MKKVIFRWYYYAILGFLCVWGFFYLLNSSFSEVSTDKNTVTREITSSTIIPRLEEPEDLFELNESSTFPESKEIEPLVFSNQIEISKAQEMEFENSFVETYKNTINNEKLNSDFGNSKELLMEFSAEVPTNIQNSQNRSFVEISTAAGISPLFFINHSTFTSFVKNDCLWLPCVNLNFILPSLKKIKPGILITLAIMEFELSDRKNFSATEIKLSTLFSSLKINFSMEVPLLPQKDFLYFFTGIGLTSFCNTKLISVNAETKPFNSQNFNLNFGVAYKHQFNNSFFLSFNFDVNLIFSKDKPMIYFQPAILSGIQFRS